MFKVISVIFLMLFMNGCKVNPTTGDSNLNIVSNEKAVQEARLSRNETIRKEKLRIKYTLPQKTKLKLNYY